MLKPLRAVVGLGSNIEPRLERLREAVAAIDELADTRVVAVSPVYETEPWGFEDQPRFLNAAALIDTRHGPESLLDTLLAIERRLGRDRSARTPRYGPRTIDLDILHIEGLTHRSPRLEVPHPRLLERPFALQPLLDVAPEAVDPRDRQPYSRKQPPNRKPMNRLSDDLLSIESIGLIKPSTKKGPPKK